MLNLLDKKEFADYRKRLDKTQREMSQLLGTSIKAVHSYEQGWRTIPPHVERQIYFLVTRMNRISGNHSPCWEKRECPSTLKQRCPAWEFQTGDLCWFINGTICEGTVHDNWREKMKSCRSCDVFLAQL